MGPPPLPQPKSKLARRHWLIIVLVCVGLPLLWGVNYLFGPALTERGAADRVVRQVRLGLPVTMHDLTSNPKLGQPDTEIVGGGDASWWVDDPLSFGVTWLVIDLAPDGNRVESAWLLMD